jgi:hypothetical protein
VLAELPTELFDEILSDCQIGKAPAIIRFAFLQNYMAVSRLDASRIVKVHDSTAQPDIQAVPTGGKLDDVRVFPLIRFGCVMPPGKRSHKNSSRCSLRKNPGNLAIFAAMRRAVRSFLFSLIAAASNGIRRRIGEPLT